MTDEEKAALDAAKRESAELKAQLAERDAETARTRAAAARRESVQFAEQLEREGRIVPRDRDTIVALQMALPEDAEVELAEDDGAQAAVKKPAREVFREILKRTPVQVDFSERAPGTGGERAEATDADFSAPGGRTIDPGMMDIHRKAVAFAEEHDVDYDTAVDTVIARQGRAGR